ncbi:hypothetical protein SSX86_016189 [Deinandra increscens subsp. villosa]|uniref:Reverse transcriptase zinc-binding domain-containing protein n=1 Tax=Deinandra increscens subsp. villosa TaxID=3103831 RepID=A0AAP0D290_9ASTR
MLPCRYGLRSIALFVIKSRQTSNRIRCRQVVAEMVATFLMVFVTCGCAAVGSNEHLVSQLGVSLASGLIVTVMIYAVGHISGAHMNPAVTIAFATFRHFPWKQVPFYVIAQFTGSISASFALRILLQPIKNLGTTTPSGTHLQALTMEIIVTFAMMFVTSAVATDTKAIGELAGIAVGSAVCITSILAGPVSGGSMNPARTIGPALVSNNYKGIWVYIVGPITGTLSGVLCYSFIRSANEPEHDVSLLKFGRMKSNDEHLTIRYPLGFLGLPGISLPLLNRWGGGGIGIGSLKASNLALLSKWGWRLKHNGDDLWARTIRAIHKSNRSHNFFPLKKSVPGYWKGIIGAFDEIEQRGVLYREDMKAIIGDGLSTMFWQDPWLAFGTLKDRFLDLYNIENNKSCTINARLAPQSQPYVFTWNWTQNPDSAQLAQLTALINSYVFRPGPDQWSWLGSADDSFHTSFIRKQLEANMVVQYKKHPWTSWVPLKTQILSWKATRGRIPVKEELAKRGVQITNLLCSWCNIHAESVTHILLNCSMAAETWEKIPIWCKFKFHISSTVEDLLSNIEDAPVRLKEKKVLMVIASASLWEIWCARNRKEFENLNTHPAKLVEEIKATSFLWLKHRANMFDLDWNSFCISFIV